MFVTGAQLYTSLDNNTPSIGSMLWTCKSIVMDVPYIKFDTQFCITQISDAFKRVMHAHVVDYGILYGLHWPCLIKELAMKPKGSPHLHITSTCISSYCQCSIKVGYITFNWLNFSMWYWRKYIMKWGFKDWSP